MAGKSVKIISNNIELYNKLKSFDEFQVEIHSDTNQSNFFCDILIVSDDIVDFNEFQNLYNELLSSINKVFYIVSDTNSFTYIKNILIPKGIIPIPKLTIDQIARRICSYTLDTMKRKYKNVHTFIGADEKVGTSITVKAIAETIARNTSVSVGLLVLNCIDTMDYIKDVNSKQHCLDDIRTKVFNNLLSKDEFKDTFIKEDNLYILPGVKSVMNIRYYSPENIEKLVTLASETFDIVLIDAGCNHMLDIGMGIGSLNITDNIYLIITQQNNCKRNFDIIANQIFTKLDIDYKKFYLIINKYVYSDELNSSSELSKLYDIPVVATTLPNLDFGWQAEKECCSLLKFNNEEYNKAIFDVCKIICNQTNVDLNNLTTNKLSFKQRFKKWFS